MTNGKIPRINIHRRPKSFGQKTSRMGPALNSCRSLRDLPDDFFDSIRLEVHVVSLRAREVVLTGRSAAIPVVLVLASELLLLDE